MIEQYADDIVLHENILLSTLGFSLMVDHPHPIIIKTIQALGSKEFHLKTLKKTISFRSNPVVTGKKYDE